MKKIFLVSTLIVIGLVGIIIYQNIKYADKKLHVVFCDVGQGDAIFIRTPKGSDILVDGGPDDSVLSCLSNNMPFWDRTIELLILTHPDADHVTGLIDVIERYSVIRFYTSDVETTTAVYKEFLKKIADYKIRKNYLWQGDKFVFEERLVLETFWPTRLWREESGGSPTNSFSIITLLTYKNFGLLLTGDSDLAQMEEVVGSLRGEQEDIEVIKIPHHGSRFGISGQVLDIISPELAVISVGENNSYGHPTPFVLGLLKEKNIKTLRTDQNGEVKIISNGSNFQILQ